MTSDRNRLSVRPAILSSLGACVFFTIVAASAQAQSVPQVPQAGGAAQEAERIQREQDLRRRQEQLRNLESARPPTVIEVPQPATPAAAAGGGCRGISRIELLGSTKLDGNAQAKIVTPFLNRCLNTTDVEALLAAVTKAYIRRGFATARAYVPGQDLSQGKLQILVIEGKVSRVEFDNGKTRQHRLWARGAFPGIEGQVLNLRDLEQGIDQLNRLQSHDAALDLRPGAEPGESIVVIRDSSRFPIRLNATIDNYGVDSTGRTQGGLTLGLDSPFGLNDFLTFTHRQSYFPEVPGDRNSSDSNSVFYSIPYGYVTVSAGYSGSRYRTFLPTPLATLKLSGTSDAVFGRVDWVARRTVAGQTALFANLTVKSSANFINGQKLTVSSRTLSVLDVGINQTFRAGGGIGSVSVGYSRGLNILGALDDPEDLPKDAPRAQFDKVTFGAGYSYGLSLFSRSVGLSSYLSAQWAPRPLYGTEQITAGGIFSVRGFYRGFLANDSGFVLRNDAGISLPITRIGKQAITLRPYIAMDFGGVSGSIAGLPHGVLGGGAAGITAVVGPILADVFAARPLFKPNIVPDEGVNAFFRISTSF